MISFPSWYLATSLPLTLVLPTGLLTFTFNIHTTVTFCSQSSSAPPAPADQYTGAYCTIQRSPKSWTSLYAYVNVVSVDSGCLFHFLLFSPFLSQFPSPYPGTNIGGHKPPPFSPAPYPSTNYSSGFVLSSTFYTPSPHQPTLPLNTFNLPSISTLSTPPTPLTPPHVPSMSLSIPLVVTTMSAAVPQQQNYSPRSQTNPSGIHSPHLLPFSQVQPTPFLAHHLEQLLAGQPVQVNIRLNSQLMVGSEEIRGSRWSNLQFNACRACSW